MLALEAKGIELVSFTPSGALFAFVRIQGTALEAFELTAESDEYTILFILLE